jgi:hypothetical protein
MRQDIEMHFQAADSEVLICEFRSFLTSDAVDAHKSISRNIVVVREVVVGTHNLTQQDLTDFFETVTLFGFRGEGRIC